MNVSLARQDRCEHHAKLSRIVFKIGVLMIARSANRPQPRAKRSAFPRFSCRKTDVDVTVRKTGEHVRPSLSNRLRR